MMLHEMMSIFGFLPTEMKKASELRLGDVAFIHARWLVVVESSLKKDFHNHGSNQEISTLDGGGSYLSPDYDVKIVRRDLFDSEKMQKFLTDHLQEMEKLCKQAEEEEAERMEEEKRYLRDRLRDLGD